MQNIGESIYTVKIEDCVDMVSCGERELAAYILAVTELFGFEEAQLAAEDWLETVRVIDCHSPAYRQQWQRVTVTAAARLAYQLSGKSALAAMIQPS
jgi:hypothetical protein